MTENNSNEDSLLEQAREMDEAKARQAFLDAACVGNPRLRARLEELLAVSNEAEAFFAEGAEALKKLAADRSAEAAPGPVAGAGEALADLTGAVIGHYRLVRKLGEGGCGVVYVASQEEPVRREVALKVIKPGMDTRQVVARFEAERQALAMMDHPNIAKVLDGGATEQGRPYFVMELVQGLPVTLYCDQNILDTRRRLELFIQVCKAVQHAHQKGIIHRDLKPTNILVVAQDGAPVPKVIDFGVAKAIEGPLSDLTAYTGLLHFIGTPAYMSPEQAGAGAGDIDTRSDIYSLGALLYELLTGQTPFETSGLLRKGIEEMRRVIREVEPLRPSTRLSSLGGPRLGSVARLRSAEPVALGTQLQGDLDWVVMKCLEKDRRVRYESASGLAADVRRFLDDEPVLARPPSVAYRLRKMARRHRAAFAAAMIVLPALVAGLAVSVWALVEKQAALREMGKAREREREARIKAEAGEQAARRFAYDSDINVVQEALEANNLGRARDLLERNRPAPGKPDLRGWEWRYLWRRCQSDALFTLGEYDESPAEVAFVNGGRTIAVRIDGGITELRDVASRKRETLLGGNGYGRALASTLAGDYLAYSTTNAAGAWVVPIVRIGSKEPPVEVPDVKNPLCLAWSPDGKALAIYTSKRGVVVWDREKARVSRVIPAIVGGGAYKGALAFSPNNRELAIGGMYGEVRLIELETGRERFIAHAYTDGITAVAVSPDGAIIASASGYWERTIKLWRTDTGAAAGELFGHNSWVSALVFAPGGNTLISAGADQTIRLWDVVQKSQTGVLRGHQNEIYAVAIAPDGKTVASACKDGTVALWDLSSARDERSYELLPGKARLARFRSDGATMVVLDTENAVTLRDSKDFRAIWEIRPPGLDDCGMALSPDGDTLALGSVRSKIELWDLARRKPLGEIKCGATNITVWGFAADGRRVVTMDYSTRTVQQWDVGTLREISAWNLGRFVLHPAISPDERWLVTSRDGLEARVFDFAAGREIASFPAHRGPMTWTAFSNDGKFLATASEDGLAKLWDPVSRAEVARFRGHLNGVHSAIFSGDGKRLVTGGNGKEAIKIWDLDTRQELLTLEGRGSQFSRTVFSPDGRLLLSIDNDYYSHVWRAPTFAEIDVSASIRAAH
jgi:WD40 repeat protein/serine/threonine protein kinase